MYMFTLVCMFLWRPGMLMSSWTVLLGTFGDRVPHGTQSSSTRLEYLTNGLQGSVVYLLSTRTTECCCAWLLHGCLGSEVRAPCMLGRCLLTQPAPQFLILVEELLLF